MKKQKTELPDEREMTTESEDFIVLSTVSEKVNNEENSVSIEEQSQKMLEQAMKTYDLVQKQSSAFLNESGSYNTPTFDELSQLAESPQDNLSKILRINSIISKYSNLDDVLGTVLEAIRTNLNTEYRLSFKNVEGRNKSKKSDKARELINSFNEEIGLKRMIREYIPRTYMEGTVIMYLRKSDTSWTVDVLPLGVAIISPYSISGGDPVVLVDMTELKNRLTKNGIRTRGGKNMFYDNLDAELKENFCKEIYDAYKNKDQYAKLDIRYTGVMRIDNNGRKYGISPMFKAMGASLILETFMKSDITNAKARTKKIIYQLLDPVLLGPTGDRNPMPQQKYAHSELLVAYKTTGSCIYTAPAYVKSIDILEPQGEMVDKDTVQNYARKQMSAIGIGFLSSDSTSSISSAKISLDQLMRNINSIGESLEEVLEKFYRQVLIDDNLPPEYSPSVQIIDSEALEFDLKVKLATLLYSTLNASLKTTLEILNIDYEEELYRRRAENSDGVDQDFYARESLYTKGGDNTKKDNGRPKGDENDKQVYDENYQDSK